MKRTIFLFLFLCTALYCGAVHKVYLKKEQISGTPANVKWTIINTADTGFIKIRKAHVCGDGMCPQLHPAEYQFNSLYADDGHYQIYVNESLRRDFFVYRHYMSGRDILISENGIGGLDTVVEYNRFIREFKDGTLWVEYHPNGNLRDLCWADKNYQFAPTFTHYYPSGKVEIVEFNTIGHHAGSHIFDENGRVTGCEVDSQIAYPVKNLLHPVYDVNYIQSLINRPPLNGWIYWNLKERLPDSNSYLFHYTGLALAVFYKNNEVMQWQFSKLTDYKRVVIASYNAAKTKPWSLSKAQEYLEKVQIKE